MRRIGVLRLQGHPVSSENKIDILRHTINCINVVDTIHFPPPFDAAFLCLFHGFGLFYPIQDVIFTEWQEMASNTFYTKGFTDDRLWGMQIHESVRRSLLKEVPDDALSQTPCQPL